MSCADSIMGIADACPHELSTGCRPVSISACLLAMYVRLETPVTCSTLSDCEQICGAKDSRVPGACH